MTHISLTSDELREVADVLDNPDIDVELEHHPALTARELVRKVLRGRILITFLVTNEVKKILLR